jgi:hypothetical protein
MKDCEDTMSYLRGRLQKLESKVAPAPHTGFVRIIKDGELTADQQAEIAAAEAAGKLIIIRDIIEAKPWQG